MICPDCCGSGVVYDWSTDSLQVCTFCDGHGSVALTADGKTEDGKC